MAGEEVGVEPVNAQVRKLGRIVPNNLSEEGSDKETCGIFLPASVAGHPINNFPLWRTTSPELTKADEPAP